MNLPLFPFVLLDVSLFLDEILIPQDSPPNLCEVRILHPQVMQGTFVSNLCLDPCVPCNELPDALGNVVSRCASSLLGSYIHQELI